MQTNPNSDSKFSSVPHDRSLQRVVDRIIQTMDRDALVQQTTDRLRAELGVDRVVLYYFVQHWKGRVTFESLSAPEFSILGTTGPDDCFNGDYAAMYEAGRVRAIADITTEPIAECHRKFLREMNVYANLVVPVLTDRSLIGRGLWGLLVAHHCRGVRVWADSDISLMQAGASALATAPSIQESSQMHHDRL